MIGLSIDEKTAVRLIGVVFKQLLFAQANALNDTAYEARDTERNSIEGRMTIRRPWVLQGVQVPSGGKATKDKLEAELIVEQHRDFLVKFEKGGVKKPTAGHSLAVPDDGAFHRTQVIPDSKRPKELNFKLHRTATNKVQFKGDQRTFIVEKSTFERGIFQRVGSGRRSGVRLLYWLTRSADIPADLFFERNAREVAAKSFARHFNRRLVEALRSAR